MLFSLSPSVCCFHQFHLKIVTSSMRTITNQRYNTQQGPEDALSYFWNLAWLLSDAFFDLARMSWKLTGFPVSSFMTSVRPTLLSLLLVSASCVWLMKCFTRGLCPCRLKSTCSNSGSFTDGTNLFPTSLSFNASSIISNSPCSCWSVSVLLLMVWLTLLLDAACNKMKQLQTNHQEQS